MELFQLQHGLPYLDFYLGFAPSVENYPFYSFEFELRCELRGTGTFPMGCCSLVSSLWILSWRSLLQCTMDCHCLCGLQDVFIHTSLQFPCFSLRCYFHCAQLRFFLLTWMYYNLIFMFFNTVSVLHLLDIVLNCFLLNFNLFFTFTGLSGTWSSTGAIFLKNILFPIA